MLMINVQYHRIFFALGVHFCLLVGFWFGAASVAHAVVGGIPDKTTLQNSAIMILDSKGGLCSGVVLAQDVILSTASCLSKDAELAVHWRNSTGEPIIVKISEIAIHPEFVPNAHIKRTSRLLNNALHYGKIGSVV